MGILDVDLSEVGFAVAGNFAAQHLSFPSWAHRTNQVEEGGEAMVETEKGKYGAIVDCRESLGKTEDNLLGV